MTTALPFIDLQAQRRRLGPAIDNAIADVLAAGAFIHGPAVAELEARLAAFAGSRHCIACSSGTDALMLALMATGIGRGDAVLVPAFTFVATAEAVALTGATPIFCDVDPQSFNLSASALAPAAAFARQAGLQPRAVIPVDLFGQPADYPALAAAAEVDGLVVIADAAQGFGGALAGTRVGGLAEITATSFFPAKPLGCYGDGGAVFCDSDALAATMRSLRVHGQGSGKYDNVRIGLNARLDTLQAAILLVKLTAFEDEIERRQAVARRYAEGLDGLVGRQVMIAGTVSAWAQYTILTEDRDRLAADLAAEGIPTAVYYPVPLHRQPAYRAFPAPGGCPVSDSLAGQVLSLPMHPYLEPDIQARIIAAVRGALGRGASR